MPFWKKRNDYELPDGWEDLVASHVARWWDFPLEDRERLAGLMVRLLGEKRWEAAAGFELTEEMRLVIASQACLIILGLSFEHFGKVRSIIVHPTTMVLTGERPSASAQGLMTDAPMAILGQADHAGGPVLIAWDETEKNVRHPERGFNVVFHEFAHKLDMLDDVVDGTPPLDSEEQRQRWVSSFTAEFQAIQAGHGSKLLWDYAGTNPGEFFAVVTEVFFDRGAELRHQRPELYRSLADFYRQDPASW